MEINKDTVNRITSMSNDQLKAAIAQIADALGANPVQKRMAVSNAAMIRKKLSAMSESEIKSYLNRLPAEKLSELEKSIKL